MAGACNLISERVPPTESLSTCFAGTPLWKLILKQFDDLLVKVPIKSTVTIAYNIT
jgi:hypothetical protein